MSLYACKPHMKAAVQDSQYSRQQTVNTPEKSAQKGEMFQPTKRENIGRPLHSDCQTPQLAQVEGMALDILKGLDSPETLSEKSTNEQAGIRRERGYGGIPLAPFPISNLVKVHFGEILPSLVPPVSLLVGFLR